MNLSKWLGATVKTPDGLGECEGVFLSKEQRLLVVVVFPDEGMGDYPIEECKRIRIVKRKKSQVLVDSLERIMALSSMGSEIYNEAEAALEKYREKDVKK